MPTFSELFQQLATPFGESELADDGGARVGALCNRLDEICGREWTESYSDLASGRAVQCTLTLYLTDEMGEEKKFVRVGVADCHYKDDVVPTRVAALAFRAACQKFGVPAMATKTPPRRDFVGEKVALSETRSPEPEEPAEDKKHVNSSNRRLLDDRGEAIPLNKGRNLLGWLSATEKRRKIPKLFGSLCAWAKDQGYHDAINTWEDDDPRIREAAEWVLAKINSLPRVDDEEDESQDPEPPRRRNPPPPSRQAEAPEEESVYRPRADDPLVTLKKGMIAKARVAYHKAHQEPCDDAELTRFLNAILVEGSPDAPQFTMKGGIHAFDDEQWLTWLAKEVTTQNADSNEKMLASNGRRR